MNEFDTPPAAVVELASDGRTEARMVRVNNTLQALRQVLLAEGGLPDQPPVAVQTGFERGGHNYGARFFGPGRDYFRGQPFEDEVGGRSIPNGAYCPTGYDRSITPESLMADGCGDPTRYICDKARSLPPWLSNAKPSQMQRLIDDYTQVGTVGQLRVTLETMYAMAYFIDSRQQLIGSSPDFSAAFTTPALSVGFRLDWGVSLLNFAPFDMHVRTTGAVALASATTAPFSQAAAVSTNRDFTVRVSQVTGGSIYVPWATRVQPGMSIAQQALTIALPDGESPAAINISVLGLPAAIFANFNAQATLLTAFHPVTAAYAVEFGAYSGGL